MGKVTRTTTEELSDAEAQAVNDAEKLDDDTIRALTEIEGADEARWQVHRISQPDAGYCGELSNSEVTLQRITDDFGTGRYVLKGIKPNGQYLKSGRVTITKSAKRNVEATATPDLTSLLSKRDGSDTQTLLLAMMNNNTQVLTAALGRPETKTEFPWPAIITALPASLVAIKELFQKPDADSDSMEKILKLVTVVEKLKGGDGDKATGATWVDVLRDAIPSLSSAFGTRAGVPGQSSAAMAAHVTQSASQSPHPELPEAVPAEHTAEINVTTWFSIRITELIASAKANRNPELRAELLLEEKPIELTEDIIRALLSRGDWFAVLQTFDPGVAPYEGWFTELREHLLAMMADADDQQTDDSTANRAPDKSTSP